MLDKKFLFCDFSFLAASSVVQKRKKKKKKKSQCCPSSPSPPIFFLLLPSCRQVWLAVSPCSLLARVLATVTLFQRRPRYYSFARRGILYLKQPQSIFFFATPDSFKHSSVTPPPSRGRTSRSQHQYSPPIPPLNRSSAESLEIFLRNSFFLRGSIKSFSPPILQDNQEDCVSHLSACRGAIALQHAVPAEREALWSNGMLLPFFTAISDGRVILTWLV